LAETRDKGLMVESGTGLTGLSYDGGPFDAIHSAFHTELCKIVRAAGARKLQLRNLIDRSGKQEYFDTIKLQIEFTIKGALRRLPDWLDGLGSTTAVQMLIGNEDFTSEDYGTSSPSFQRLWGTLREFRAGRVSHFAASQRLYESPWVRAAWVSFETAHQPLSIRRIPSPRPPAKLIT